MAHYHLPVNCMTKLIPDVKKSPKYGHFFQNKTFDQLI